jgi:hypothetical protein
MATFQFVEIDATQDIIRMLKNNTAGHSQSTCGGLPDAGRFLKTDGEGAAMGRAHVTLNAVSWRLVEKSGATRKLHPRQQSCI